MNRKSKSFGKRSSILKLDVNCENETGVLGRNRRSSRRVSFAETFEVKEFPRDSPGVLKNLDHDQEDIPEPADNGESQTKNDGITGLDKLLTGTIQTPYQTDTDYNINDMASASFNLFDKTILDPVDMETTYAGGEIGTFLPQMDFQNEASAELKFDASSLLQSLKEKTDSLKPLQIYSPNRDRNLHDNDIQPVLNESTLPLNINFPEHDKENIMMPMETFQTMGIVPGIESKALIERILGGNTDARTTQACHDDMEMTTCAGGFLAADKENILIHMNKTMNDTVTADGMLNISSACNKPLKSGGLKMQSGSNDDDDRTKCFNLGEEECVMEETKCVGGILNGNRALNASRGDELMAYKFESSSAPILNSSISDKAVNSFRRANQTIDFKDSEMSNDVEETKVVGGIVFRTFESATNNDGDMDADFTQNVPMTETKTLGNIFVTGPSINAPVSEHASNFETEKTVCLPVAMEETKPLGGILRNTDHCDMMKTKDNIEVMDHDMNAVIQTAFDGTKQDGVISTAVGTGNNFDGVVEKTVMLSEAMEETRPVGGIQKYESVAFTEHLNSSIGLHSCDMDKTAKSLEVMEETKPVGGILDKSVSDNMDERRNQIFNQLNATSNQTIPLEETKPVGGILNKTVDKSLYFEDVNTDWASHDLKNKELGKASDGTIMSKQLTCYMDETKCVTGVIEVGTKDKKALFTEGNKDIKLMTNKTVLDVSDMSMTRANLETTSDVDNDKLLSMEDIEIDEEISFRGSNYCRNSDDFIEADKTKDFTQTTTNLNKLREKLILSQKKSMTKTPSKISPLYPNSLTLSASKGACKLVTETDVTRSPAHKRQKLFDSSTDVLDVTGEEMDGLDKTESTAALLTAVDDASMLHKTQNSYLYGIDDEQMPDTMYTSLSPSSSYNDRKHSSSSHDTTAGSEISVSYRSNDNTRNNTDHSMSTMSNKSFASSSFAITDIDLDDLREVLVSDINMSASGSTKKTCKEMFLALLSRSHKNMDCLEKMYEETQTKIYQDCENGLSDEMNKKSCELYQACYKQVYNAWKVGTKMFDEQLQDAQGNGITRCEEVLNKVQTDNKFLDDLLTSIDKDLKDLEETERSLNELEQKQGNLKMELAKLLDCVETETDVRKHLETTLSAQNLEQDKYHEERTSLSEQILSHLICTEWCLEDVTDDKAVFSFLDEKVELCVEFEPGVKEKSISNISLHTIILSDICSLEDRIALDFVSRGISTIDLRQKYKTLSSLTKLLHEVSCSVSEIRRFCKELENIHAQQSFCYVNNRLLIELWTMETVDFITLGFTFDPSHPLTKPVSCSATVKIGRLESGDVEKLLQTVEPGKDYLRRLLRSVDFKFLHAR